MSSFSCRGRFTRSWTSAPDALSGGSPVAFESLERRSMLSGSPTPDAGIEYFLSSNDADDNAPFISESADPYAPVPLSTGFKWFDGTVGSWLLPSSSDMAPITVNSYDFWPRIGNVADMSGSLSEANTRAVARSAAATTGILIINIERWVMDIRNTTLQQVDFAISQFDLVIDWVKSERPNLKIGIYGFMPLSDQWHSSQYQEFQDKATPGSWYKSKLPEVSKDYALWQNANRYLSGLAAKLDFICPSLYTGGPELEYWEQYARSMMSEARRYGKPVLPFLLPRYHKAVPVIGDQLLPPAMWQLQLDIVRELGDGAVIWTGNEEPMNPDAGWVQTVFGMASGNGSSHGTGGDDEESYDADMVASAHAAASGVLSVLPSAEAVPAGSISEQLFGDEQIDKQDQSGVLLI